jgi:hypothetical protein
MLYLCAGFIIAAHVNRVEEYSVSPQPLHLCLLARNLPLTLIESAIRHFGPVQSQHVNAHGDLPLHIAAREWRPDEDAEEDFLPRILNLYPDGARVLNEQEKLPLDVAVDDGRRWNSGIRLLLNAHPLALQSRAIPHALFPMILGELLEKVTRALLLDF